MATGSKHLPCGEGGGHSGTQVSPDCGHGCEAEHVSLVHCMALVSKHIPTGAGAAHRSEQNSLVCEHGCPGAHGSVVHSIAVTLKQVPVTCPEHPTTQPWNAARQAALWPPIVLAH